uniref:DnaJ homologue subfamily C GRV2/DNAJC13 N-terminal domain-containing protein n=1 Tax=Meloidogyne javanica TaxID=6303 RepID=A0A915N5Y9_MELJA
MKIPPPKSITLVLRGEKKNKIVWKDYEEFNSNKKSVVMVIKPYLGSTNKHCSAMAANHYYQIFLCRKEVCGGHGKLFLMRKLKTGNKEQPKLMKMDEGEDVHVTHIFIVEQKSERSEVINQIIKRCKGTEHVIEGVTYKAPSVSKKQHPNNNKKPDHNEQQKHSEGKPEHHEEHKDNSKLKDNSKHKDESKHKLEHHAERKDNSKIKDNSKHIDDSKHKESNKKVDPAERRGRINSPNNKVEDKKEESHQSEKDKGEKGQKDNKIAEHSGQKDGHQPNSLKNPKSSHLEEEKIKHKENINSNIEKPVSDLKDGNSLDKEGEKKNENKEDQVKDKKKDANVSEICLEEKMPENILEAQLIQKIPQRVEFAEMNAGELNFFGGSIETEGGANKSFDSVNEVEKTCSLKNQKLEDPEVKENEEEILPKQKRKREGKKPPEAIVSPLIRQKQIKETRFPPPPTTPQEQPSSSSRVDEDKDIDPSVVSQIVGNWWFGERSESKEQQQTHAGHEESDSLKKELRRAQLACKEKERHLGQLRERLAEIETIVSSGRSAQLAYCAQLSQRLTEREQEFVTEMDGLIASHEHRVRQLVQEIVDLRAELARKDKALLAYEQLSHLEQSTQTDNIIITEDSTSINGFVGQQENEGKLLENKIEVSRSPTTDSIRSVTQPQIIQAPNKASVVQIGAEVLATLEAYRAEIAVWRTRCANLELIMQDLLLREGARRASESGGGIAIGSALFINVEEDNEQFVEGDTHLAEENLENKNKQQSNSRHPTLERQQTLVLKKQSSPVECQMSGCVELRKKLTEQTEEINKMLEEMNEINKNKLETENKFKNIEMNNEKMVKEYEELAELAERRGNDAKAIKLSLQQVQSERDHLEQALAYLERRCYALEQLGLENGIVLANEPPLPEGIMKSLTRQELEFTVRESQGTQTALTVDDLGINEKTMDELQIRIRVMQSTFAEDRAHMGEQLADIERILLLKTELTNTLASQLDEAAKRSKVEDDSHQFERDLFRRRIEELGRIAERVPILESEIEKALSEKSKCELRLRDVEERLNDTMEKSLENALKREKAQECYWTERMDAVDRERIEIAAQLEHERRRAADERLKWALERADLERRLTSAIEHAEELFSQLNCPKRDVQIEVRPRTSNKYVFCRPNQKDQQVDNSDLRDEQLEELVDERVAAFAAELVEKVWEVVVDNEMHQQRRKTLTQQTTTPSTGISAPDFLTIAFQRKGALVEFGGSIPLGKLQGQQQQQPFSSTNSISIASLPTNLGYNSDFNRRSFGDEKGFKSCERLEEWEEEETDDESVSLSKLKIPRHLSLPYNRLGGSTKSILRSHSAPRRQEVEHSRQRLDKQQLEEDETQFGVADKLKERVTFMCRNASQNGERIDKEELFDQLNSWLEALAENEKHCYELKNQNLAFKRTNCEIRGKLKEAELELWIYRTEPRREAEIGNDYINKGKWKRSCSAEQIGHNGPPLLRAQQLKKWKEVAGTCFREVNNLRRRLNIVENDRLTQIGQVSILRGELAMAKVQAIHSAAVAKFAEERGRNSLEFNERNNEKWKSVPELAETNDFCQQNEISQGSLRIKKRREAIDERERSIVSEALRRQFTTLKEDRDKKVGEQQKVVEELKNERKKVSELSEQLNQVTAECGLLRRENGMYEQKCVEMDRDRQKIYKRIFSVGNLAITTYNPQSLEITNQWLYEDFFSINVVNERPRHSSADSSANTRHEDQFTIHVRKKGGKSDSMRFSSEFAREIVTEALRFQNRFASDRADQKPVNLL